MKHVHVMKHMHVMRHDDLHAIVSEGLKSDFESGNSKERFRDVPA